MRWLYQKRGFLFRALVCWIFSLFFLKFDESGTYDIRFQLRGEQKVSQNIVLITLKTSEFSKMYDLKTSNLINTNELSDLSDSFYWDRDLWRELITKVLEQKPAKIGVTLYFGGNVGQLRLTNQEISAFKDPRVIWSVNSNEPEKLSLPIATKADKSNIAHIDTLKDDDGIVRRLILSPDTIPNIAERLVKKVPKYTTPRLSITTIKDTSYLLKFLFLMSLAKSLPKNFLKIK